MSVSQDDKQAAADIYASVVLTIPLVRVRNASASPAGRRIQARVTWQDPATSKTVIGYVSVHVPPKPSDPLPQVDADMVCEQGFRIRDRARAAVDANPAAPAKAGRHPAGQSPWERARAVHTDAAGQLSADASVAAQLQPVCDEINRKMKKVRQEGGHHGNKRGHNQKRARKALASTLDFVLASGISDDEVKEMLKEALVRHTMES